MENNDPSGYETHLGDQIDAAQKEQEEAFKSRAEALGIGNPIVVSEAIFEKSFYSQNIPWLVNPELRKALQGCRHIESPQPLWTFFDSPNFVQCEECAQTIQMHKSLSYMNSDNHYCEICKADRELSWTFASYQYFTISGLICNECTDAQSESVGESSS